MSTKKKVLLFLEKNKDKNVSGGFLSRELGVSRTAIWKAINSLKEEGYEIISHPNSGYSLSKSNDMLLVEAIEPLLENKVPLFLYDKVDSTNRAAASIINENIVQGTTIVAKEQTHGRGRRGRSFYSPQKTGLYMSIILKPKFDMDKSVLITTGASVAVSKAIEKVCNVQTKIKWVNDIYYDEKKICGILTEAITNIETGQISHIIIGIGVNCFTEDFPYEAGKLAGSIMGNFSRNKLAAEIINQVLNIVSSLSASNFIKYYREHSMVIGKDILVFKSLSEEGIPALAKDIDNNGSLIVEYQDGKKETLSSGEITIRV